MIEKWLEPVYNLYDGYGYYFLQHGVPNTVLLAIQIVALSVFALWYYYDKKYVFRKLLFVILFDYIVILLGSTIIYRSYSEDVSWSLVPFWTYKAVLDGEKPLLMEIVLNVIAFIPIGLLAGCTIKRKRLVKVLVLGATVSIIIELGQLLLKKGFSELDDVIHNTTGCAIGLGFVYAIEYLVYTLIPTKKRYNGI